MNRRLAVPLVAAGIAACCASPALRADDVYLHNGRMFDDVVAVVGEREVRIRIAGGELAIPRAQVLRVEQEGSALGEYLEREAALRRRPETPASAWLELARWARARGLGSAARQAALTAAELSPRLDGLAEILHPAGLVLDAELGRWIPYADSMRRRGFVEDRGEWVRPEELAVRQRREERDELARLELVRARAEARRAEVELARAIADGEEQEPELQPPAVYWPVWTVVPVPIVVPPHRPPQHPPHRPPAGPDPAPDPPEPPRRPRVPPRHDERNPDYGVPRVPGSLIPGRY